MKNKHKLYLVSVCTFFFCAASAFGSWTDSSSWFSCSGYSQGERVNPKNTSLLSIPSGMDTCAYLRGFENVGNFTEEQYHEVYDSLRLYVELCGPKDCTVLQAFPHLDAAVQFMSNDTTRFDQYRTWLLSVLYLNPSCPEYFCEAMASVEMTYQQNKYKGTGTLAVENYLRKYHPECFGTDSASIARENKQYAKDSLSLIQAGMDPTHLPPLDSIGLSIVIKHDANAVAPMPTTLSSQYIASFTASPNPFTSATKLNFALNRMSYVTIEVYDLLGNKVFGNAGRSYEAGSYEIALDGSTLSSGTLYARISTGFGEVKTVKLIHEK